MAQTPTSAGRQMSSGLKERLKRCGRYHTSPSDPPVNKQPRLAVPVSDILNHPSDETVTTVNTDDDGFSSAKQKLFQSPWRHQEQMEITPKKFLEEKQHVLGVTVQSEISSKDDFSLFQSEDRLSLGKNGSPSHGVNDSSSPSVSVTNMNLSQGDSYSRSISFTNAKSDEQITTSCVMKHIAVDGNEPTKISGTPVTSKSRLSSFSFKGSKLTFSDTDFDSDKDQMEKRASCPDSNESSFEELMVERDRLQKLLAHNEDTLRKLNMVKMYRAKNDLATLCKLIEKWRSVSQEVLQDLHNLMSEPKPTLTELINHFQIDHTLVNYNAEEESFS
ncbi:hypothetical protein CHS0354_041174 [Potamilus streckersoni]|uniref:Swi5-dependent recombination DNA repair protein 1 homolog n=1 Tax=Potamilus streckersoni TaxID=2493646 RepID=A0AAE0SDV3_9BIVA|nr:hypothetical protein CHS0354_041174 [Potamilus streckersoni]